MSQRNPPKDVEINLAQLYNVETWEKIERQCQEVVESIPNLSEQEQALEELRQGNTEYSKEDLDRVFLWKYTVGKNRIYNVKYLNAVTDGQVRELSRSAIARANQIQLDKCLNANGSLSQTGRKDIQETVGELGKLKGVGPTTASAILTLVRPDVFCYLYDEVIDCFEQQRDYKISNYLRVNSCCLQIAKTLRHDWTTARVARTIWLAARFLNVANNENGGGFTEDDGSLGQRPDPTMASTKRSSPGGYDEEDAGLEEPADKRRRDS